MRRIILLTKITKSEVYKKASKNNCKILKSFKILKKLNFIEFPLFGFQELKK